MSMIKRQESENELQWLLGMTEKTQQQPEDVESNLLSEVSTQTNLLNLQLYVVFQKSTTVATVTTDTDDLWKKKITCQMCFKKITYSNMPRHRRACDQSQVVRYDDIDRILEQVAQKNPKKVVE